MHNARLLAVAIALAASTAHADGARFEAHLAAENVTLDQMIELVVTLDRDGNQALESYRAPQAPELDLLHSGTSEQMQMTFINGRQSVRVVEEHQYVFRARKKGSFQIGTASARVGGQQLQTRPLVVHVAPVQKNALSTVQPSGPQSGPTQSLPPSEPIRGDEDVFIDASCDKPRAFLGQQVSCTWRLFTRADIIKHRALTEPKLEDFWSEDLFVPGAYTAWDRQTVNGQEYAVAQLLKKALFPLKAGKLAITPLEVEVTTMQTMFGANASAVRRSKPLSVEGRPLPIAGRPPGFDPANVGQYELLGSIDKTTIKADEAVTLRLTLRGAGNLRNARLGRLDPKLFDGWKVFDPTTKETLQRSDVVRGDKLYTILLMPKRGGTLTIPAVELPYFDPATEKYQIAKSPSLTVRVEGEPSAATTTTSTTAPENLLAQQLRPIRARNTVRGHVGESLWRGRLGLGLLAGPPSLWLLILIADRLRRSLGQETEGRKRRRARRAANKRLRVGEYHIRANRPSAFFAECARVIYEHLEYRLGQKVEAFTLAELRAVLEARGFSKETAEAVVKELESCDFARFAPSASGPGEMRAALRRVRTLVDWIEQARLGKEAA